MFKKSEMPQIQPNTIVYEVDFKAKKVKWILDIDNLNSASNEYGPKSEDVKSLNHKLETKRKAA